MDPSPKHWCREPFSALSHLLGAGFFAVGLIILLLLSRGQTGHLLAFGIYGGCAILLYLASGIYHWTHKHPDLMRRFDHAAIYAMIAGTYTPVCLLALPKPLGYQVLAIEWGLGLIGIVASLSMELVPHWMRIVLYVGMGWFAVAVLNPLRQTIPGAGIDWLIAGGVLYTVGILFYATERPTLWPGKFDAHDLWHLFVLSASACHYVLMLYLLPA